MDNSYICTMPFLTALCCAMFLYLSYLPFAPFLSMQKKVYLFHTYAMLFWFETMAGTLYIVNFPDMYSASFLCCWISIVWVPFFFANLTLIPQSVVRHIFVLGMDSLYMIAIHTIAGNIIHQTMPLTGRGLLIDYPWYPLAFLGLSILCFPLVRPFFRDLFSFRIPNAVSFWLILCPLPFGIFTLEIYYWDKSGALISNIDWIPGIIGYFLAFFMGWAIHEGEILADMYIRERNEREKNRSFLRTLLEMAQNLERTKKLLAPIESHISALEKSLDGRNNKALTGLKESLSRAEEENLCENEALRSALAPILARAEAESIPLSLKLSIPEGLEEERSLSLLLSILAENALEASEKQKKDRRQLTIAGKMEGNTLLFLIRNRFDEEVPLGENGLPLPSGEGQGLGMRALSAFLSHYDAQVLWKQEAGRVNVFLKCRVEES